jgi:hypothetical protein
MLVRLVEGCLELLVLGNRQDLVDVHLHMVEAEAVAVDPWFAHPRSVCVPARAMTQTEQRLQLEERNNRRKTREVTNQTVFIHQSIMVNYIRIMVNYIRIIRTQSIKKN